MFKTIKDIDSKFSKKISNFRFTPLKLIIILGSTSVFFTCCYLLRGFLVENPAIFIVVLYWSLNHQNEERIINEKIYAITSFFRDLLKDDLKIGWIFRIFSKYKMVLYALVFILCYL